MGIANFEPFASPILLLLQLASSAGTYPLELTNKIFQAINPWLLMSYSVSGLRQTISMGDRLGDKLLPDDSLSAIYGC